MAKIPRTMPTEVADAINAMPEPSRTRVLQLRDLVLAEAAARGIAPLEETLKWGQPSYYPVEPARLSALALMKQPAAPNCSCIAKQPLSMIGAAALATALPMKETEPF